MSNHSAQIARRFAWQLEQKYRHLQENASGYSWAQSSQKQRRRLRTPGLVDAQGRGRRRLVCHARSQTVEHPAYGRPARGLSPSHCAAGYSDATSSRGPNYACCCRADHRSARGAASVGPLAAEAGVGRPTELMSYNAPVG